MQEREAELAEGLESAQASLAAMQRLYTVAQNQLFELQSKSEEAAAGEQRRASGTYVYVLFVLVQHLAPDRASVILFRDSRPLVSCLHNARTGQG
jgi:hypothetical protein